MLLSVNEQSLFFWKWILYFIHNYKFILWHSPAIRFLAFCFYPRILDQWSFGSPHHWFWKIVKERSCGWWWQLTVLVIYSPATPFGISKGWRSLQTRSEVGIAERIPRVSCFALGTSLNPKPISALDLDNCHRGQILPQYQFSGSLFVHEMECPLYVPFLLALEVAGHFCKEYFLAQCKRWIHILKGWEYS